MSVAPHIFLSFVDLKDPFVPTGVEGESELGPVLSMLAARPFDAACLFHTPQTQEIAESTLRACRERHPRCDVSLAGLQVSDPKDYSEIMGALGRHVVQHAREARRDAAEISVCVSSGTAEMRTAWFMLVASGMLPAKLLQLGSPAAPLFGPSNVKEVELGQSPWGELRDLVMPLPYFRESRVAFSRAFPPKEDLELAAARELRDFVPAEYHSLAEAGPLEEERPLADLEEALRELGIHVGSAVTRELVEKAAMVAGTSVPVLITGETGTGKELVAKLVHRLSLRRSGPFVAVNCGTMRQLAESLLFGHKKGSFTGADRDHPGFFEQANRGTLFLDELGELTPDAQASLLRALQDGEIHPLGAKKPVKVDVRVVAATNRNLQAEIQEGRFRQDLYYRLEVAVLPLRPLRERRAEIVPLALKLLDLATQRLAKQRNFSKEALKRLEQSEWPGNVRDLANTIERSVLFSTRAVLGPEDLLIGATLPAAGEDWLSHLPEPRDGFSLDECLSKARRHLMLRALEASNGNQSQAARLLGISKQAVNAFQKGLADNGA